MSRNGGMSGANNTPLGPRGGGGSLSAQAGGLGGISLLNPSYLASNGPESSGHSSGSGRRSKFGPPVEGKNYLESLIKALILEENASNNYFYYENLSRWNLLHKIFHSKFF